MGDNTQQIEEWNGPSGQRWAALQDEFDRSTKPFGDAALAAARARPGEKVLDIGCGCGATSLVLAETVGTAGAVLGVDVSQPMLEVARRRAAGVRQLSFMEADASIADLPADRDLLFSRFGVMFFAAPVPAFAHMRRALTDTGRLAFVCWRAARENPWAVVPVMAARTALKLEAPPSDPHAPGPFAFGDDNRLRQILLEANFKDVSVDPFDTHMALGTSAHEAASQAVKMGPVARVVREAGPERLPAILEAVEAALQPLAGPEGVKLPARAWVVTARAG